MAREFFDEEDGVSHVFADEVFQSCERDDTPSPVLGPDGQPARYHRAIKLGFDLTMRGRRNG